MFGFQIPKKDPYLNIARLLKNNVEQISGILSVNVIINSDVESTKTNNNDNRRFKIDAKRSLLKRWWVSNLKLL